MSYVDTIGRWGEGNIDLNNRIVVYNRDGTFSTERSFSVNIDNKEVLLPTIVNGRVISEEAAINHYYNTGEYLGKFDTVAEAEDYAERLHERQEWYYGGGREMGTWSGMKRNYSKTMGIKINGDDMPDVSKMGYQVGDLDTSGRRDATGLLHRNRVATKINYEFTWNSLEWGMLQYILTHINSAKFTLTAPDPRSFQGIYTGYYYVGDRTGECLYYLTEKDDISQYSLKLKFIEY